VLDIQVDSARLSEQWHAFEQNLTSQNIEARGPVEAYRVKVIPLRNGALRVKAFFVNTTVFAGPSIGFDAFLREGITGKYSMGVLPGAGYGVKWQHKKTDPSASPNPYLAIDLFLSGLLSEEDSVHKGNDYFNIDVLPTVTVGNWVSIGYGQRIKIGLEGLPTIKRPLFTFGIHKAT